MRARGIALDAVSVEVLYQLLLIILGEAKVKLNPRCWNPPQTSSAVHLLALKRTL